MTTLLLDAAPIDGGVAAFAAVAFLFVCLAVAFIAFKLLRKSVKTAVRIAIVALIIAVAVAGSAILLTTGSKKQPRPARPAATR